MEKKVLGTISILTSNRQGSSLEMNQLLSAYGHHIIARLGVNINRQCVSECPGLITLTIDSTKKIMEELTTKLNSISSVHASMVVLMEE